MRKCNKLWITSDGDFDVMVHAPAIKKVKKSDGVFYTRCDNASLWIFYRAHSTRDLRGKKLFDNVGKCHGQVDFWWISCITCPLRWAAWEKNSQSVQLRAPKCSMKSLHRTEARAHPKTHSVYSHQEQVQCHRGCDFGVSGSVVNLFQQRRALLLAGAIQTLHCCVYPLHAQTEIFSKINIQK